VGNRPREAPRDIRRRGRLRTVAAGVCTIWLFGLCVGLVDVAMHDRWSLFASGLVSIAFWGWITWSLWSVSSLDARAAPLDRDPGWPHHATVLFALVPGVIVWYARPRQSSDGLLVMRALVIAFTAALVLFGNVLARLSLRSGPVLPWVPVLGFVAVADLFVDRAQRRRLDWSSPRHFAETYRTAFFLHVALATSIALIAFAISFGIGPAWIYYPAAVLALLVLWTGFAIPRSRELDGLQREALTHGFTASVIAALRTAGNDYQEPSHDRP
jgi:hypothetical protein